jgi:hypothetical protein
MRSQKKFEETQLVSKINHISFFNINCCNLDTFHKQLFHLYTPKGLMLNTGEQMTCLAYTLCQGGTSMQHRVFQHPSWFRNMAQIHNNGIRRKIQLDAPVIVDVAVSLVSNAHNINTASGAAISGVMRAVSILKTH